MWLAALGACLLSAVMPVKMPPPAQLGSSSYWRTEEHRASEVAFTARRTPLTGQSLECDPRRGTPGAPDPLLAIELRQVAYRAACRVQHCARRFPTGRRYSDPEAGLVAHPPQGPPRRVLAG